MKKKHAKPAMQPHTDAHPGIEMDGKGHPIPMAERLADDRRKVHRDSTKKAGKRGG